MTEPSKSPSLKDKILARTLIIGLGLLAIAAGIGLAQRDVKGPDFNATAPAANNAAKP